MRENSYFPYEDPSHTLYSEALPPLGPPNFLTERPKPWAFDFDPISTDQFQIDFDTPFEVEFEEQGQLFAGTITADEIKALTAGSIAADCITPGSLAITPIAANELTADKIEVAVQIPGRALRYNTGKAKLSFVPLALIEGAAVGLQSTPYRSETSIKSVLDRLLRDAYGWVEGEDLHEVTGVHRLEEIAAHVAYLAVLQKHGDGTIAAPPPGAVGLTIVPAALLEAASRAMVYGANKYARNNWRKGFPHTELMDCLLRHAVALASGQERDDESGLHHIDHIAANIAFLLHMRKTTSGTDDRAI